MLIILPLAFGRGWTKILSELTSNVGGFFGKSRLRYALLNIFVLVVLVFPFLTMLPMRNEFRHIDWYAWLKDNYIEASALLWWAMIFCGIATFVIGTIRAIVQIVAYKKMQTHQFYVSFQKENSDAPSTRDTEPENKER